MGLGIRGGHQLFRLLTVPGSRRFERQAQQLEAVQRGLMARWVSAVAGSPQGRRDGVEADWSWETFGKRMPIRTYKEYAEAIGRQKRDKQIELINSPVERYQPTSGSTSAVKWVPYTKQFVAELDIAITAWMGDLYRTYPSQSKGTHYWSLSWIPTHMRAETAGDINDDMKLLSYGKRALAYLTQAAPQEIALAATSDDSLFATIAYLAADSSLSFISVWSPTFALGALEYISTHRVELAAVLAQGHWGARKQQMAGLVCPRSTRTASMLAQWDGRLESAFFRELWPHLGLLSSWDTAAAAPWAAKLRELLPQASFQGKGLWSTEGVVTFPFQGRFPLAYTSHVFEFEDVQTQAILPPWKLQLGQCVIPILTTGSGFGRYRMSDVVRVDGFLGGVPCFTFLGRNDGVDMVGEKLSATSAQQILNDLPLGARAGKALPVTLIGIDRGADGHPAYVLLVEYDDADAPAIQTELGPQVERALLEHFHYRLARELGQLGPAVCVALPKMRDLYLEQCRLRGMIEGNIKIEPLRHWPGAIPKVLESALYTQQAAAALA